MNDNYDTLPKRGKITSDGIKIKNCKCGGLTYASYEEDRIYNIICTKCGKEMCIKQNSMDAVIKQFNMEGFEI